MVVELLEIRDASSLYRVGKASNIILRMDPLLIIPLYRLTFFIDMRRLDEGELAEIFRLFRDKIVLINNIHLDESLTRFIEKITGSDGGD